MWVDNLRLNPQQLYVLQQAGIMSEWYFKQDGEIVGPLRAEALKKFAAKGIIRPTTLVRKGNAGQWVEAKQIKGLEFAPPPDRIPGIPVTDDPPAVSAASSPPAHKVSKSLSATKYLEVTASFSKITKLSCGVVNSICFSRDGRNLVIGSSKGIVLWNVASEAARTLVSGEHYSALALAAHGELAAGFESMKKAVRLVDMKTGAILGSLSVSDAPPVNSRLPNNALLSFAADGTQLFIGRSNGRIGPWKVTPPETQTAADGKVIELPNCSGHVIGLATAANAPVSVCATNHGQVVLCNPKPILLKHLRGEVGVVNPVAISPSGDFLAVGNKHAKVCICETQRGSPVQECDLWTDEAMGLQSLLVLALAFSPDGSLLAGSATDGTVRIWEAQTGVERRKLKVGPWIGYIHSVCFSPDGSLLAAATQSYIWVWDLHKATVCATLKSNTCFIATAAAGSETAWEVLSLRQLRDNQLRRSTAGRLLINFYEAWSPPIAIWLAHHPLLRRCVRELVVKPAACVVSIFLRRAQQEARSDHPALP